MFRPLIPAAIILSLAALGGPVASANPQPSALVRIGESATLSGRTVTVLKVLEDSRCPSDVTCAWAGQVRLSVRVSAARLVRDVTLVNDSPVRVAGGVLTLVSTRPDRRSEQPIAPGDYRFVLKFSARP